MGKVAMVILGATLIMFFEPKSGGETVIAKGQVEHRADVLRDPATGLPLFNRVKGPAVDAAPRGDKLQ